MSTTETHLTHGWEPDTPVADTVLRRFVFAQAASAAVPVSAMGGRVVSDDAFVATDLGRPGGYLYNAAVLRQPLVPDTADEVLDAIEDFYAGGTGEVLLLSAWPTPDLRGRGWQLEGHPPLLLRPPGDAPQAPAPPGFSVEEVTDAAALRDWEQVAVEGFPFSDLLPYRPGRLVDERVLADGRLRLWVGYADGRAVSNGGLYTEHGLAVFTLGVTRPEARHRGYWKVLATRRLRIAPDLPAAGLFSDMSRPGAQRLGFLPILRFTLWHRTRGEDST